MHLKNKKNKCVQNSDSVHIESVQNAHSVHIGSESVQNGNSVHIESLML